MKKLALIIVLAGSLVTFASAKEIDVTKAKGTHQDIILSLDPKPAQMDVDQNVTIKAVFTIELDVKHIKKNDIKLKLITQTKESIIEGDIAYITDEQAVTFNPLHLLEYGYYEIEFKSLKATKANKDQQIKEIKYRLYVPEVINGYKLPPNPDSKINDATLQGVDVNDNGVRDDVERKIVYEYPKNCIIL